MRLFHKITKEELLDDYKRLQILDAADEQIYKQIKKIQSKYHIDQLYTFQETYKILAQKLGEIELKNNGVK